MSKYSEILSKNPTFLRGEDVIGIIQDFVECIAELEKENTKNLGWIAKAMMRGLTDINCGDELIKIAESNNLEQQAKGIEAAVRFLERPDVPMAPTFILNDDLIEFAEKLREQAKQIKEQDDE